MIFQTTLSWHTHNEKNHMAHNKILTNEIFVRSTVSVKNIEMEIDLKMDHSTLKWKLI